MAETQTAAGPLDPDETPEATAAIAAMKTAGDEIAAAINKAWPSFVDDYDKDGPHPLSLVANILCRQQWIFTQACITAEGKTAQDEVFFATAKACLVDLTQGLQRVGNVIAQSPQETVQ